MTDTTWTIHHQVFVEFNNNLFFDEARADARHFALQTNHSGCTGTLVSPHAAAFELRF